MHAIFLVTGSGVAAGRVIPSFENIEIYPYMSELLGLNPAPVIDGHRGRLAALIRSVR